MSALTVVLPLGLMAVYLWLSFRILLRLRKGLNLRTWLTSLRSLGFGHFLSHSWLSFLLIVLGTFVLIVASVSFNSYLSYRVSPSCGDLAVADCRALRMLEVTGVESQSAKSGEETVLHFSGGSSATFYADSVPLSAVSAGGSVTAEVWHGEVTALVLDGSKHESFATQSTAWIGIAAGAGMLLLGCVWLVLDLGLASMEAEFAPPRRAFTSPTGRRRTLSALLLTFGALNFVFAAAMVAFALGAGPAGNILAVICLVGAVFVLPALAFVYMSWFIRAYVNAGALGLDVRHRAGFVFASLIVPPLSLFMPYRLMEEIVTKTRSAVVPGRLQVWWASLVGWLGLLSLGLAVGSPDPNAPSPFQIAVLTGSAAVGLLSAFITLRLVGAVDATELALHEHRQR